MMDFSGFTHEKLVEFAETLKTFLKTNRKMSNKTLAEILNVHPSKITRLSNYRKTEGRSHKEKTINKILDVFKVRPKENVVPLEFEFYDLKDYKKLIELALKLSLNLIDVSTKFEEKDIPHEIVLRKERLDTVKKIRTEAQRERLILITGAGASFAATKGIMPLSSNAIRIIEEEIGESTILKNRIEKEINRITLATRLNRDEFETQLLAYSKYAPDEVIAGLKKMCKLKHIPNLIYEILGHMLKHRFLDVAFNFNFDEIFDVILKEEVGEGEFRYIFSDGHCPDPDNYKELLISNRLKQPVYIKPHGTISHTSSLRFTRESFSNLPEEISATISNIINAPLPKSGQKHLRVNFLIIGYGMKSPELAKIIKDYLSSNKYPEAPYFWFFDKKSHISQFGLELSDDHRKLIEENHHIFRVDEDYSLEDYMKALWELVQGNFKDSYQPRGIERHLLINLIFDSTESTTKALTKKQYLRDYFKDRILVELTITLLSSDGILNLQQIMEGRIAYYLHEYNELVAHVDKLALRKLCKDLGMKPYNSFTSDVFVLDNAQEFLLESLFEKTYDNLLEELSSTRQENLRQGKASYIRLSKLIKERNILKITPRFKHPHNNLFYPLEDNNILNTSLNWTYRYRRFIEKVNQWDLLLAISERGRFLKSTIEDRKLFNGKKVGLILSALDHPSFSEAQEKEDVFDDFELLSGSPLYLPWWSHNRHLLLFMKRKRNSTSTREFDNWDLAEGFYYEGRLLSRKANPVHITQTTNPTNDRENKKILLEIFINYWDRANFYTQKKRLGHPTAIPVLSHDDTLEDKIDSLLKTYYSENT